MTEYRCGYAVDYPVDAFFCFTITIRRPILRMPHYTEYQYFLYEIISKLREKGMTFNQIADHLKMLSFIIFLTSFSFFKASSANIEKDFNNKNISR